ncbi:hypothetical protein HK096_004696, partial [Nowakowskiella sp. JEL0078]
MVLESVVAGIVNQFIGDYVDNVETNQLSVGVWNGDVVLSNLKLKRDALDKFNLPVDVVEGYIGDLSFKIPWNDLKNKPVKVYINNVYLLATPRADSDYEPEEEEDRTQALKQDKIKAWEMFRQAGKNTALDKTTSNQNASFTNQVATKIADNLQVTMKNIHIRYENHIHKSESESEYLASQTSDEFSMGLTLAELSAVSTNEDWIEKIVDDQKGFIHKLVKMESLAAYWNTNDESLSGKLPNECLAEMIAKPDFLPPHQFLLEPVSGTGK